MDFAIALGRNRRVARDECPGGAHVPDDLLDLRLGNVALFVVSLGMSFLTGMTPPPLGRHLRYAALMRVPEGSAALALAALVLLGCGADLGGVR